MKTIRVSNNEVARIKAELLEAGIRFACQIDGDQTTIIYQAAAVA